MTNVKIRNLKGENGGIYEEGTATHEGDFDAIFAHAAASVTVVSPTITGTTTTVAIPAGATWYGRFTSVQVLSGSVTIYNAC